MSDKKSRQEPVYPDPMRGAKQSFTNQSPEELHTGMSKRFYAACAAMQGILSNPNSNSLTVEQVTGCAYESADELLKQENK